MLENLEHWDNDCSMRDICEKNNIQETERASFNTLETTQGINENTIACAAAQKENMCRSSLRQAIERSFKRSEEEIDKL